MGKLNTPEGFRYDPKNPPSDPWGRAVWQEITNSISNAQARAVTSANTRPEIPDFGIRGYNPDHAEDNASFRPGASNVTPGMSTNTSNIDPVIPNDSNFDPVIPNASNIDPVIPNASNIDPVIPNASNVSPVVTDPGTTPVTTTNTAPVTDPVTSTVTASVTTPLTPVSETFDGTSVDSLPGGTTTTTPVITPGGNVDVPAVVQIDLPDFKFDSPTLEPIALETAPFTPPDLSDAQWGQIKLDLEQNGPRIASLEGGAPLASTSTDALTSAQTWALSEGLGPLNPGAAAEAKWQAEFANGLAGGDSQSTTATALTMVKSGALSDLASVPDHSGSSGVFSGERALNSDDWTGQPQQTSSLEQVARGNAPIIEGLLNPDGWSAIGHATKNLFTLAFGGVDASAGVTPLTAQEANDGKNAVGSLAAFLGQVTAPLLMFELPGIGSAGPRVTGQVPLNSQAAETVESLFGQTFTTSPLSHTAGRQNGVLGETLGRQILEEQTSLTFNPLQNRSGHGADIIAIDDANLTIWNAEVKSSQNGVSKAASAEGNPSVKLQTWVDNSLYPAPGSPWNAQPSTNQALAQAIQDAIDGGYQVRGVQIQVGVPTPGTNGVGQVLINSWK